MSATSITPTAVDGPTGGSAAGGSAAERIADLHRSGRLVEEYPQVPGLLAEMPPEARIRAGRILARTDPREITRRHPALTAVKIAIAGHSTLSPLIPSLTVELARHGLVLDPHLDAFDGYVFALSDVNSELYSFAADLTLCVLDPTIVTDELPVPWTVADVEQRLDEKIRLITGLVGRFEATSRATLVLNTFPLPRNLAAQLVDYSSRGRLGALWRAANARLLALADDHPSVVVLDLDPIIAAGVGPADPRLSAYAKAPYSPDLLVAYAREVGQLARLVSGRTRKCLALDLDGTLWGGILAEDGPEGIEVADSPRGEAFQAFQRVVKQLGSQGVLVAAVSKNDAEPVRRVLAEHPQMTLAEGDFTSVTANWAPKHENLLDLARRLNIGVSALVFVDDSPYECGLVRHELPDVAVIPLDTDPASHVERLLADGWFDVREVTDDDRARPARYREEADRGTFLDRFSSIDDYLRELRVRVRLAAAGPADIDRLSQLTLRTNQFNLTTRRLQPAQVRQWADDPAAVVLAIHSADRFGDNGTVGAIFARRVDDGLYIDNFLLSCRVFSRGIEHACLAALLRYAHDTGLRSVRGRYTPTAKNGIVADFYPRYGFHPEKDPAEDPERAGEVTFRHDLVDIPVLPGHVHLDAIFSEGQNAHS
jgi:FkbH-like protein